MKLQITRFARHSHIVLEEIMERAKQELVEEGHVLKHLVCHAFSCVHRQFFLQAHVDLQHRRNRYPPGEYTYPTTALSHVVVLANQLMTASFLHTHHLMASMHLMLHMVYDQTEDALAVAINFVG